METYTLAKGIVIGFSIAAPVGPIGLLCIQRSLNHGPLAGLLTGLGAATADACYGCIAAFGLSFVTSLLTNQKAWLQPVGGLFLCYLGIATALKGRSRISLTREVHSYLLSYGSAFFLTLTNPLTILSFAAIFAGIGMANASNGTITAMTLVAGVFTGSTLWWVLLTGSLSWVCRKLNPATHRWLNRLSGGILLIFGMGALLNLIL